MRRSLAGVLLLAAGAFLALSLSTLWLDRVAFSPSTDADAAEAVLGDEDIRSEVAALVAAVDAPVLGQSPAQLKEFVEQVAALPAGAALMTQVVHDAHAKLIGEREDAVQITAAEQVVIVRDERVALLEPITVPVQEVGVVAALNDINGWITIISAGLGLLSLIAGFVTRPERGEVTFAAGVFFGALGIGLFVFGYLVPVALLPALSDATWMGLFPRLANESLVLTIVLSATSLLIAALILFGTTNLRQRRQWSTPLAVGRYRQDHSWSR